MNERSDDKHYLAGPQRFRGSLADEVWLRMKEWVKEIECAGSADSEQPTLDDCVRRVERIVAEALGREYTQNAFPRRLVEFYAAEAYTMIEKLHSTRPGGGLGLV